MLGWTCFLSRLVTSLVLRARSWLSSKHWQASQSNGRTSLWTLTAIGTEATIASSECDFTTILVSIGVA